MRRTANMGALLAAVQEHLAGPLGAKARQVQGSGPAHSVVFEHWGNTVAVLFDRGVVGGRPPVWVKVTVGTGKALFAGDNGYVLAELGSQGVQASRIHLASEQSLTEVLQGALAAIRRMSRGRPRRSKLFGTPDKALRVVHKELAGPLCSTAELDPADGSVVLVQVGERPLAVQFSRDLAQGSPEWVRVSLGGEQYLHVRPDGFEFARPAAGQEEESLHYLHTYGDIMEVLRGTRSALESRRVEPWGKPMPPLSVVQAVRESFVGALGLEGADAVGAVSDTFRFAVAIVHEERQPYTLVLDPLFLRRGHPGRWVELLAGEGESQRCLRDLGDRYALEPYPAVPEEARLPVEGLEGLRSQLESCASYLVRLAAETAHVPAAAAAVSEPPAQPLTDEFWSAHLPDSPLHTRTVLRRIRRELNAGRWFGQVSIADVLSMARKEFGQAERFAAGELAAPLSVVAAVWARRVHSLPATLALALGAVVAAWASGGPAPIPDPGGLLEEQAAAELQVRRGARRSLSPWETDRFLGDLVAMYQQAARAERGA